MYELRVTCNTYKQTGRERTRRLRREGLDKRQLPKLVFGSFRLRSLLRLRGRGGVRRPLARTPAGNLSDVRDRKLASSRTLLCSETLNSHRLALRSRCEMKRLASYQGRTPAEAHRARPCAASLFRRCSARAWLCAARWACYPPGVLGQGLALPNLALGLHRPLYR